MANESPKMQRNKKQYVYDYPRPAVTVDVVVLTSKIRPKVLLIRRKHAPFASEWAIPGGFVDMEESLEAAAARELQEETSIRADNLEQLRAFGDPGRDPRGRVISVVYLTFVDTAKVDPEAGDDAAEIGWHSLFRPPALAFDHAKILAHVRRKLKQTSC